MELKSSSRSIHVLGYGILAARLVCLILALFSTQGRK